MAEYHKKSISGLVYHVPETIKKPRKKAPPFVVVMNQNCTQCSGASMCVTECPVDCIHPVNDENGRPVRVYVDNDVCIGCMNCFSYEVRTKHIMAGDKQANMDHFNSTDLFTKKGVCPWDAIEIHEFQEGVERSKLFYTQPQHENSENTGKEVALVTA